ncbi:serine hydrolase [Streptomyces sp. HPF1205]|uniref:serine hydrolase domain-containing protein n=1 Tax=Streptomyces sp. HPF1205 TaxID=2873262 RepID=UPI001CEC6AED|nr:serine hydrolase domain-containing protein [Streptomyces sp. HPF1205]
MNGDSVSGGPLYDGPVSGGPLNEGPVSGGRAAGLDGSRERAGAAAGAGTGTGAGTAGEDALRARLTADLARLRAPDAVLAVSRHGRRTVACGGSARRPAGEREGLRYAVGSLSKTYTALLLAELAHAGAVGLDDPVVAHLPGPPPADAYARRITLRHLATHTSGLPRVPPEMVAGALLRPYANGYAHHDTGRLLRAFARARPRNPPGSRWRYSNFGGALLGTALAHAAGTDFAALLTARVLRPLRLYDTGTAADPGRDATGHRADGRTPLAPAGTAGFAPAAGVRATPADLLAYTEAHLRPGSGPVARALRGVQVPLLRRGFGHRHCHTLAWYRHPAPGGPLLFHAGATFGMQAFAGFHPASGTAVVGLVTRHDRACRIVSLAHALLYDLASSAPRSAPQD